MDAAVAVACERRHGRRDYRDATQQIAPVGARDRRFVRKHDITNVAVVVRPLGGIDDGTALQRDTPLVSFDGGVRDHPAHRHGQLQHDRVASLPVALTLVPMLAAQLGKIRFTSKIEHFKPLLAFDRGFNRMIGRYRKVVGGAVKHPYLVLGSAVALCIGAGFVARTFDSQFLPMVDDGIVSANLRLPPGTPPNISNQVTLAVEQITKEMPGVLHVYANAGFGLRFVAGADSNTFGRNMARGNVGGAPGPCAGVDDPPNYCNDGALNDTYADNLIDGPLF